MRSIFFEIGTAFTLLRLSLAFSPSSSHRRCSSIKSSELYSHNPTHDPVLITFDLDDTLFPISPVIKDANNALLQILSEMGYDAITEESMIASSKEIRQELREEGIVVTYTELRKKAIEREMLKLRSTNSFGSVIPRHVIEKLYNVWETERHLAAERHLFSDTIDMLDCLLELIPGVSIGAITNGKGDPFAMKKTIDTYFDFCVSGEDDGVFPSRKPHSGIYEAALNKYWNLQKCDAVDAEKLIWIHVGDDLANDVGGSQKVGAKSIFVDLNESYGQAAGKRFTSSSSGKDELHVPAWSTISKEEAEKREVLNREALTLASGTVRTLKSLPLIVADIIKEK